MTHHFQPSPVDDRKGSVTDQVLRVVLVDADRLHGDDADDDCSELNLRMNFERKKSLFHTIRPSLLCCNQDIPSRVATNH